MLKKLYNKMEGVTLLEVLIAMLLFSVVTVFIFTAFSFQFTSLAKNRKVTEEDTLGVKEIEEEIQNIKDFNTGDNPGFDIDAIPKKNVSVFEGRKKRVVEVFEVEKNIGEQGKNLSTLVANGKRLKLISPIISSLEGVLKVDGIEVDYAYINEDFEVSLDMDIDPKTASHYLKSTYRWFASKVGHDIYINRNTTEPTEHQLYGIPRVPVNHTPIPETNGAKMNQRELMGLEGAGESVGVISKEFKGGYIDVAVMPISKQGKIGSTKNLYLPVYIVGLPYTASLFSHIDMSLSEGNVVDSNDPEEADNIIKDISRKQLSEMVLSSSSTGIPDLVVNDINDANKTGKFYKYLDFKGKSIYRMIFDSNKLYQSGNDNVNIFVVARPKNKDVNATILSADYAGNLPGWSLDFKGFRIVDTKGERKPGEFNKLEFSDENINDEGWNLFHLQYKFYSGSSLRVNGVDESGTSMYLEPLNKGLTVGGYENKLTNTFNPSSVEIAEVLIYSPSTMHKQDLEGLESYLFNKYSIKAAPGRVKSYLPDDWD